MSWLGIKLLHHRRLLPTLLSPRVVFLDNVDRVLPLFCRSSHHMYASEDVPTCKEITEEGATNPQVRLIYEFYPNFRQKSEGAAYIQVRLIVRKIR